MKDPAARKTLSAKQAALQITAIYVVVAGLWLLFSDSILLWFSPDANSLIRLKAAKEVLFLFLTAAMLAWLVQRYIAGIRREDDNRQEISKLMDNIIAHIPHYVFWKGRDSRYLGCNQRFASVAGVGKPENIVGKSDADLVWREKDAEITRISDQEVMKKIKPLLNIEETQLQADGHLATYMTSKVPLQDESGNVIGVLGICADITVRKREEEALRESERRLSTLMANLPGMVYRCRNDPNWTMKFVSDGSALLTGYPPADFVENNKIAFADLIHPEDREKVWQQVQAALEEKRPFKIEYRIRTAAGAERWVWEQGSGVYSAEGQLLALEGFITDITERKRGEQSRAASGGG